MPPKSLANAKRNKRVAPAVKAGLELMAQLGGIQVLGTSQQPYYYFPPSVRQERGIERCTRCIQACGKNAACNVQPFTRAGTNLWKSRKCHYCTIFPAELDNERCSLDGRFYLFNHTERRLVPVTQSGEILPALANAFDAEFDIPLASAISNGTIVNSMTAPITPPPEKDDVAVLPDVPQPTTPDLKSQDIEEPVTPPTATMSEFGLYTPVATPSLEKGEKKTREQPADKTPAPPSPTLFRVTPLAPVRETAKAVEVKKPAAEGPAAGSAPVTPTAAAWLSYFNGTPVNAPPAEPARPVAVEPAAATAAAKAADKAKAEAAADGTSPATPTAATWLNHLAKPAPKPVETVKPLTLKAVPIKPATVAVKAVEPAPAPAAHAVTPAPSATASPAATATPTTATAPASVAPASAPATTTATATSKPKTKSDRRPVALAPIWGNKPSFDLQAPPTPSLANFVAPSTPTAPVTPESSTPLHTSQKAATLPVPVKSIYTAAPASGPAPAPASAVSSSSFALDPISQLVSSRRPAAVLSAVGNALQTELATLDDLTSAIAELRRLLALKEEEHAAQLRKVDSYRSAIDDALNAIDEEQRSLRTMRARLAGALLV